jgi:hypothetical protein
MYRLALVLAAVAALAGCATGPNPLTADQRGGVFVKDVSVSLSPDEATREAGKKRYDESTKAIEDRLQTVVAAAFKNSPSGAQAVTLKIAITRYYPDTMVKADVSVVRVSDGQVLGVYPNVTGIHAESGGLLGAVIEAAMKVDYVGIVANSFAATLQARFNGA